MSPAGMRQYAGLDDIKGRETGCVAAVGNFDGIHLGHQEIEEDHVRQLLV